MAEAHQPDMAEFFNFDQAAIPEESPNVVMKDVFDAADNQQKGSCPSHPNSDCLCHGLIEGFGFQPDTIPDYPAEPITAEDYANFEQWIPRYKKPEQACEYCRALQLECFFTFENQRACSACNALFRPCSFVIAKNSSVMDTLHTVQEDACMEQGALTGSVALKSFDRSATDLHNDDDDRPTRKTGTRFSRAAVKVLKEWMDRHRDHPYPTDEEKEELRIQTGLKANQISNWLANTRRRTKIRTPRGVSPSIRSPTSQAAPRATTEAIDIPFDKSKIRHNGKTWDIMNPLERWQHSPPENEPAPVSAIVTAVAKSRGSPTDSSLSTSQSNQRAFDSSAGSSSFSVHRAPSLTSLETGRSDSRKSSGSLSNLSLGSSRSYGSRNSWGSGPRKDRRRRRRTAANPGKLHPVQNRPFQCTFCTDTFVTKYDWTRHEKSLHLSLEKWLCAPLGPVITVSCSGQRQCVYCGQLDPTDEHLETHNHNTCEEKGLAARTFYRKDHLRQHLRLVHGCKMIDSMDSWKIEASHIRSRCGFCGEKFQQWQDRVDHLAKHFKAGAKMADWKGCRGLDPAVAAQVTNAMPPYLIANEAKSPLPFSATNTASLMTIPFTQLQPGADLEAALHPGVKWPLDWSVPVTNPPASSAPVPHIPLTNHDACLDVLLSNMDAAVDAPTANNPPLEEEEERPRPRLLNTCWEVLTLRMGRYVREQLQAGVVPTDDMMQRHARMIEYGDDDPWNQTAADHPEWLDLFKKAHGVGGVQPTREERSSMMEDLGANLGDLDLDFDQYFGHNGWDGLQTNDVTTTSLQQMSSVDAFASSLPPVASSMDAFAASLTPAASSSSLGAFAASLPTATSSMDAFAASMSPMTASMDAFAASSLPQATSDMDEYATSLPLTTLDDLLATAIPTTTMV